MFVKKVVIAALLIPQPAMLGLYLVFFTSNIKKNFDAFLIIVILSHSLGGLSKQQILDLVDYTH